MEPMFPSNTKSIADLALDVMRADAELAGNLSYDTSRSIVQLLRHINSYYSNRIEGEHTSPVDIERAVKNEFSNDEFKKRLQILNVAHIRTQQLIDEKLDSDSSLQISSPEFISWIHSTFYSNVPASFLEIQHPSNGSRYTMIPGEFRNKNVSIGEHIAPTFESIPSFMEHFRRSYDIKSLSGHDLLIAAAASHHRLVWIHPFLDGNGRVSRLFTYAFMRKVKLNSYGLWTLSRGFARKDQVYRSSLALADSHRENDLDGRGNLSEKALAEFCNYFFETSLDQIQFMSRLLNLNRLRERVMSYCDLRSHKLIPNESELRPETKYVLAEIVTRGRIERSEVSRLIGMSDRTARDLTKQLLSEELVISDSHRSPLRFNIPAKVVGYYFPELYPPGSI